MRRQRAMPRRGTGRHPWAQAHASVPSSPPKVAGPRVPVPSPPGDNTWKGSGIPGTLLDRACPSTILAVHGGTWLGRVGDGAGRASGRAGFKQGGQGSWRRSLERPAWRDPSAPCPLLPPRLSPSTAHCTAEPDAYGQATRSCLDPAASSARTLPLGSCTFKSLS